MNKIYRSIKVNKRTMEQSITSQNLRWLRRAGLVKSVRDGKFILYSLDQEGINKLQKLMEHLAEYHEDKVYRKNRLLEGQEAIERKALMVIRALNHDLRMEIVEMLQEEPMSVTDIEIKTREEQSVVSQHLAVLRRAGIVAPERNGKFMIYSIKEQVMEEIAVLLDTEPTTF